MDFKTWLYEVLKMVPDVTEFDVAVAYEDLCLAFTQGATIELGAEILALVSGLPVEDPDVAISD